MSQKCGIITVSEGNRKEQEMIIKTKGKVTTEATYDNECIGLQIITDEKFNDYNIFDDISEVLKHKCVDEWDFVDSMSILVRDEDGNRVRITEADVVGIYLENDLDHNETVRELMKIIDPKLANKKRIKSFVDMCLWNNIK